VGYFEYHIVSEKVCRKSCTKHISMFQSPVSCCCTHVEGFVARLGEPTVIDVLLNLYSEYLVVLAKNYVPYSIMHN